MFVSRKKEALEANAVEILSARTTTRLGAELVQKKENGNGVQEEAVGS